jgi:hypothetical protein
MPAIKYRVTLRENEKSMLEAWVRKGKSAARSQTRARILLKAATGCRDEAIVKALAVSEDHPRPAQKPKLTDRQAAQVIAIACSPAPERHEYWTLRLLVGKVVELGYAESISHEAMRQLLKKHLEPLAEAGVVHSRGQR